VPFGMVSEVGRGMGGVFDGVFDGVVIVEKEGAVLGVNLGRPVVTNGDFATRLFPDYFGQEWTCSVLLHVCIRYYTRKFN